MRALSCWFLFTVVAQRPCLSQGAQLYVMLPLDTVTSDGQLTDPTGLPQMLDQMKDVGVDGFMVDVWWGITEPSPGQYRFDAYKQLVALAKERGFEVQCVTSFHQCGGNAGDNCNILLPPFVYQAEGIWYRDGEGRDDREYVSLFADEVEVAGRTPLQMYSDWFEAFADAFEEELGSTITVMMVGMGPSGELRYPSYRLSHWNFCGIGEFQAYDPHALASLKAAAAAAGHAKEWGSPPNSSLVGNYNSYPRDTDFFSRGFGTDHGRFFLDWYSSALKGHAVELLSRARAAFGDKAELAGKVAGIHWWYGDESHAAEATAGYYNTNWRNAYAELADVFKSAGASLDFTCMEMRNTEQPAQCLSRPEDLVRQVLNAGREKGVPVSGENALERYDDWAYGKMLSYRQELESITYLRLTHTLQEPGNLARFRRFVARLHGQDGALAEGTTAHGGGRRLRVTNGSASEGVEAASHWI
eukprot:CAMPEP_0179044662 /NCGR_PEP_ID=MMETSP0796-20121207/17786_1 /TAXON_ID=73915 /ORGANISM="Pyrodinium bahamense, Strain pbaha01" /LENGTH=471 /DNA_ID=CAMNT_0020741061 /DNA_START=65 /DNA_END=1480 /DNA_ORIENTATION=+